MPTKLIISALALFIGYMSAAQVITFKEPEFDFGDIGNVHPVTREVQFENTGDKQLVIENVKGSCGCTTGELAKDVLEPGEVGSLTVSFNPEGRNGKQRKRVIFTSNDTENENKSISFTANIVPSWDTLPDRIEFTMNDDGATYTKSSEVFHIRNHTDKPITVDKVYCNGAKLQVTDPGVTEIGPGASLEVTVSVAPDFIPERTYFDMVRISATVDGKPTTGRVRVYVRNPASISE